jgi:hypothetical protein
VKQKVAIPLLCKGVAAGPGGHPGRRNIQHCQIFGFFKKPGISFRREEQWSQLTKPVLRKKSHSA